MKRKDELEPANSKNIIKKTNFNTGDIIDYFSLLGESNEPFFKVLDLLSFPIEIFAPDGTTVYSNRAGLEMLNCKDPSLLIGKYNPLKDPVCMDELGYRKEFEDAFKGLKVIIEGFPAPINDLLERGVIADKPFEAGIMDLYIFPVKRKEKLIFVVCEFHVRNLYRGRPDVVKAKEYIDTHWKEEFDKVKMAKAVGMSVSQLYKVFTDQTSIPPGEYYNMVKTRHIKDKLEDPNLSIKEAFAQCGEDSRGNMAKVFKEIMGHSPAQYRKKFFGTDHSS